MRHFLLPLLFALAAPAAADPLLDTITAADGWATWQVPMVAAAGEPCCYESYSRSGPAGRRGCDLDGRHWNVSHNRSAATAGAAADAGQLAVYARVKGGKVDTIRAFAASCPVYGATAPREIAGVQADASVAWLADQARAATGSKDGGDESVAALAYHATPRAMTALQELAAASRPQKQREAALFWIGQARGAAGADAVARYAREDADAAIRQHAVFVLSQSAEYDTYPRVLAVAGSDRSGEVRGQALFWLAQMEDARAAADILAALRREKDEEVREQAVFALSQLPAAQADQALIGLIRGDHPREIKQKALFWLGQSGSDAAIAFLDEVLR